MTERNTIRWEQDEDGIVTLILDDPEQSANTMNAAYARSIRAAIDRLTPDLRMVVVLRYTEGLAYEEIAAVMGCSSGTVASRLNRAHKTLERRLSLLANTRGVDRV